MEHAGHAEHTHHSNYVMIWAILLGLLAVSVLGPMAGIKIVTLLTAFGVAIVKAYLVARHFMHINIAAKYVTYLVMTALVFMFLLFAGTAPDVMKPEGRNWAKPTWLDGSAHPEPAGGHGEAQH
jgi:caa(3)-type oxidase subunit IV